MSGNTFGRLFRLTTYGESHGPAIGVVLEGVPAGLELDLEAVQRELDRRKPGQDPTATARRESDTVQVLSGVFEGKTIGAPLASWADVTLLTGRDSHTIYGNAIFSRVADTALVDMLYMGVILSDYGRFSTALDESGRMIRDRVFEN
mgnify:CR=1 FL=1